MYNFGYKPIQFIARGLKPNTTYYPFFDDSYVGQFCSAVDEPILNADLTVTEDDRALTTNQVGTLTGVFYLPAQWGPPGKKTFKLVDNTVIQDNNDLKRLPSPIYGSAQAIYTIVTAGLDDSPDTQQNADPLTTITYFFDYKVDSTSTQTRIISSSSSTPPVNPSAEQFGIVLGSNDSLLSATWISTSSVVVTVRNQQPVYRYDHSFSLTIKSTVQHRHRWIGSPPAPEFPVNFRPSGLNTTDTVTLLHDDWQILVDAPDDVNYNAPTDAYIGQSFMINSELYPKGMFATSIAVYFRSVDTSLPVKLDLREVNNNLPDTTAIENSVVVKYGNTTQSSPNATIPTVFVFERPIYLKPSQEYCFTLSSSSLGYNVWCAKYGEKDVTSSVLIDGLQQSGGSLFSSKNGKTWVPELLEDMKFDVYKADFATNLTGQVKLDFTRDSSDLIYGSSRRISFNNVYTTKDSYDVVITAMQHGLTSLKNKITITSVKTTNTYNGIPGSAFNVTNKSVTVLDENTFRLTLTSKANKTGHVPTEDSNALYPAGAADRPSGINLGAENDLSVNLYSDQQESSSFNGVNDITNGPTITSTVIDDNSFVLYTNVVTSYVKYVYGDVDVQGPSVISNIKLANATFNGLVTTTIDNQQNDFVHVAGNTVNYIMSKDNESTATTGYVQLALSSTDKNLSPVIDLSKCSLVTKNYRINNQENEFSTNVTSIVDGLPYFIVNPGTVTSWSSVGASGNVGESFIAVGSTGIAGGGATVYKNSEVAPNTGTALAKYKSDINVLGSNGETYNTLMLHLNGNAIDPCKFDVYIRASLNEDTHTDQLWTLLPVYNAATNNILQFTNSASEDVIDEWLYVYQPNRAFTIFDVKVVMRSTNTSIVPRIYGLRAVASNNSSVTP